ncbi:MAG: tail fiber domain-containing protein, partial [Pseudomonadota bacterium]|nr:tail fiber domain-containing protein [Pseudomonadota bacterium]
MTFAFFEQADNVVGSITGNGSNASFNTSSDYRLKENIVNITDGITRLKQLTPRRFNWIADSTNTLEDGFIAHE